MSRTLNTLVLAASNASTSLMALALAALMSRVLTKHDYASYRQTLLIYTTVAPLLELGLSNALTYFIARDPRDARRRLFTALALLISTGGIFATAALTILPSLVANAFDNPDLRPMVPWVGIYAFGTLFSSLLPATLLAYERYREVAAFSAISRLVVFAAAMSALFYFRTPYSVVVAVCFTTAAVGATATLYCLILTSGELAAPSYPATREMLAYAIPLALAGLLEGLALAMDRLIVASMCDPEEFAVFANGATEIPFVSMLTGAASAVILPQVISDYRDGRRTEAHELWKRASQKTAALLFPIAGLFFVTAPSIMTILYSPEYESSATPFRWYLLLLPARSVYFAPIFQAARRTDLILKRAVGTLLLNGVVSFALVNQFGVSGAAIGTVVVFWAYVIPFCTASTSRLLTVPVADLFPARPLSRLLAATIIATLAAILAGNLFTDNVYARTCLSALIFTACYIGILVTFTDDIAEPFAQCRTTAQSILARMHGPR